MVRTRFAPSPTGFLHIGGVRTALFNWLFARSHGGRFILRIDDTDRERNLDAALAPILDGFRWLGIDWDEGPEVGGGHGPYFQSQRQTLHRQAAERLLAAGLAYWDYARAEEMEQERQAARRAARPFVYSRRWLAATAAERRRFEAEGRSGVLRLKLPRDGACRFQDRIRGEVTVAWAGEQDHVIQRADGSCLYNLASVVDDHEMRITHVIRAEEHLSNTPRQIFIAEGLGYPLPEYAHLPFVAEPGSKNKLSKRKLGQYLKQRDFGALCAHGQAIAARLGLEVSDESFNPVLIGFYAEVGYLPDAIVNYLALLGWALDDRTEELTREQLVEHFSLERVHHAPASFDPHKLLSFQERYMRALSVEQRVELVLPYLRRVGLTPERELLRGVVAAAGDRIKVAGDILEHRAFFVADGQLEYDERALEARLRRPAGAAALLAAFGERLAKAEPFEPATLERTLHDFAAARGIEPGPIVHPLRVAVTGRDVGFGLYESLALLGRERCRSRIERALGRIHAG